jgi:hypothetical protein
MRKVVVDMERGRLGLPLRYIVWFKGERAEHVERDPHGSGRRGRPVHLWWRLKGEPSSHVQKIIERARAQVSGLDSAP